MTCTGCHAPTSDGIHLCEHCTDTLHATINDIPDTLHDLDDTVAKLDTTGPPGGTPGSGSTPPVRLGALQIHMELRELIISWAMMLLAYDTQPKQGNEKADRYLRRSTNEIRRHDFAGDMLRELHSKAQQARRIIDRPQDIRILGACQEATECGQTCEGKIKADYTSSEANCENCGSGYQVQDLIEHMQHKARGELMTGPQAVRWLSKHAGVQISYKDIRNWIDRKHVSYVLARVTTGKRDTKLIYPGDALQVHQRTQARTRQPALA